jgi:hypothetical protein
MRCAALILLVLAGACGRAELEPYRGAWKMSAKSLEGLRATATGAAFISVVISGLGESRLEVTGDDAQLELAPGASRVAYAVEVTEAQLRLRAKGTVADGEPSALELGCIATISGSCVALRVLAIDGRSLESEGVLAVHLDRDRATHGGK